METLKIGVQNERAIDTHWKSNPEKGMALFHALHRFERYGEEPPPEEVSPEEWREMKAEQEAFHKHGNNGKPKQKPKPPETHPKPTRNPPESNPKRGQIENKKEEGDCLSLPSVLKGKGEGVSGDAPTPPARARPSRFVPPTIEEVREYWATGWEGGGPIPGSPERFFDHFEAVGWRSGRARLKDWRAAARNWGRRQHDFTPTTTPPPPKPEPDPYEYRGPLSPEEQWGDPSALPSSDSDAAAPSHEKGGAS